ncbi:MAG: hypothetical protein JNL92_23485 [Opitutaceae bacterium]|nr:hypothetical protein [Opitutaceae bacterium]
MKTENAIAKEWDEVRSAFAASIMVDTSINSLAQNLDGPEWPIKSKEDTPSKYIDLTYEEVVELLLLKGQKEELVEQLVGILRGTLAFDTPYGDMVAQAEAASERENPILRNLSKLGIPENFPIALTALDKATQEFCELEKLTTLAEFAIFSQGMSQSVIVGGDFRRLLNALSHVDEKSLAEVLPYRPGQKGLHLVEAIGQAARSADGPGRTELATTWFRDELATIERDIRNGGSIERYFVALGNPELEKRAVDLLRPYLRLPEPPKKKSGWFSWFSRK